MQGQALHEEFRNGREKDGLSAFATPGWPLLPFFLSFPSIFLPFPRRFVLWLCFRFRREFFHKGRQFVQLVAHGGKLLVDLLVVFAESLVVRADASPSDVSGLQLFDILFF